MTPRPPSGERLLRQTYNTLVVPAARLALPVLARFRPKLARGIAARRDVLERWEAAGARAGGSPRLWVHAASAGEALQARPVADAIRVRRPEAALFFSYTSPSTEPLLERWETPDHADYLPFDEASDTGRLVEVLAPDALVLVGGETWPNLVWTAADAGVPIAQAACRLVNADRLRRPVRRLTAALYGRMTAIAAVAEADAAWLERIGVAPAARRAVGDPRIDATLERARRAAAEPPPVAPPAGRSPVLVAGSTWPDDEAALVPALARLARAHPRLLALVAPHEPSPDAVAGLVARAVGAGLSCARLSDPERSLAADLVVVDRVGLLYRLYGVADVAYVGGGFRGAVHNTMEPAATGAPVVVGADHGRPHEVVALERAGGLAAAASAAELETRLGAWLADPAARSRAATAARAELERLAGATARTLAFFAERGVPV